MQKSITTFFSTAKGTGVGASNIVESNSVDRIPPSNSKVIKRPIATDGVGPLRAKNDKKVKLNAEKVKKEASSIPVPNDLTGKENATTQSLTTSASFAAYIYNDDESVKQDKIKGGILNKEASSLTLSSFENNLPSNKDEEENEIMDVVGVLNDEKDSSMNKIEKRLVGDEGEANDTKEKNTEVEILEATDKNNVEEKGEGMNDEEDAEEEEEDEDEEEKEERKAHNLSSSTDGLSDYELIRLENIRRNQEFLSMLGLDDVKPHVPPPVSVNAKKGRSKVPKRVEVPALPCRRSARVANGPVMNLAEKDDNEEEEDEEEEEEEEDATYDDSAVLKYVISTDAYLKQHQPTAKNDEASTTSNVTGLQLLSRRYYRCNDLPAIYSMQFHPCFSSLLLTAGKGGYLAVFNTDTGEKSDNKAANTKKSGEDDDDGYIEDERVLISFRPHNRWVASAKFVSLPAYNNASVGNEPMLVLTASDDAEVKLWDLSIVKNSKSSQIKVPKLVCSSKSIHSKCIFSMDETGEGRVLTGSKDKAVCLSRILPDGSAIKLEREFNLHSSVVKTVCWQSLPWLPSTNSQPDASAFYNPGTIFASGGQDRRVCIKDTRTSSSSADISMENVHTGGVHTAVWSPSPGVGATPLPLLLTAAVQDNTIKVFDLRKPDPCTPLFSYRGHTHVPVAKIKSIQPPKFLNSETIIAMGEGSSLLSLYCAKTGLTISRGSGMEDLPMHIACHHDNSSIKDIAVACKSGSIWNLRVV